MRRPIVILIAGLLFAGCGQAPAAPGAAAEKPAVVEPVAGSDSLHHITLTPRAYERLGIQTAEVMAEAGLPGRTRVPYSAVIYGADGDAWAYVVDGGPNEFVRHALTVADIVPDARGDYAILAAGPSAGMHVVSVGVAELYGTEFDVGH
jgi:hypothetical protein